MVLNTKEKQEAVLKKLQKRLTLTVDQAGHAIAIKKRNGNPETHRIQATSFRKIIINMARSLDLTLSRREIESIQLALCDTAEASDNSVNVYLRVAAIENGIELDVGNKEQTRIRLTPSKVKVITKGSETFFYRPSAMQPFVMPSKKGNLDLIYKYLNFDDEQAWLLIVWICYTLSTPRASDTNYPILVLIAEQGAAKSTTCKLIIRSLLDPSQLGIQGFPSNRQDMVLAANHAHILIYDNLRYLSSKWSDTLCIASTGGNDPTRKLYTDGELMNHPFQVPLVLNGIHDFIEEPDLAQRCLRLELNSIAERDRRDEREFTKEFNTDLPKIFKGLLDLTADILKKLPKAKVTHPQRMLGYVRYLAATEKALKMKSGRLQAVYSDILNDAQLDSVLENPLASAVLDMMQARTEWNGTPSELLTEITEDLTSYDLLRRSLPTNPISLSKRLNALKSPLRSQQINIFFTRGKERRISITNLESI
ncbi:MAG: hypothetical protein COA63_009780 [Methylophaga sp.]|nr:hypothetical protein [Methylophaga sp.]